MIPGLGKSPGEGKGYPLHYSGLKNSMDSIVHGLTKSRTQMSNLHFSFRQIFKINYLDKYLDYLSLQDWKRSVFIPIPKKRNARLDEAQGGIKRLLGESSVTSKMQMTSTS